MFDTLSEAYKALGPWPILQFAAAVLMGVVGYKAIQRGEKDRKPDSAPPWALYGPVHEVMQAVHDMSEQGRKQVDLLERIDTGIQAMKITIELIRNESRLR